MDVLRSTPASATTVIPAGGGEIAFSIERAFPEVVRCELLGVETFAGRFDDAVTTVVERASSREGGYIVQCNVHVLMEAQKDAGLMRAMREAWLVMPDGAPIAWLERCLGERQAQRVGGPDLMAAVLDRGREASLRHFFLGSTPETLADLVTRVAERFPGVDIVGAHSPPFEAHGKLRDAAAEASAAEPDIVWVGLGAPKQELWMQQHASSLSSSLVVGVGAAFDFHAGVKHRAPVWLQRIGLEWTHRLAHEPTRLTRRYVTTGSAFACRASACLARRGKRV